MVAKMYLAWAQNSGRSAEILDQTDGTEAGIKNMTIQISGEKAYGYLRAESGVHRLVRLSPFNSDNLRQTSFAEVEVLPVIDETSRTATARVIVQNADRRLRPGQFVSAEIDMNTDTDRLHVPTGSIVSVEGRPSLFVPIENGFKPRLISAGPTIDGRTVILSGLNDGEDYVSEGAFTLKAQIEKDAFGDDHDH